MLIAGVLTSLDYSARRMATSDECVIEETVEGGERIIVEAHGKRHCRKVVVVIGERLFWTIVVTLGMTTAGHFGPYIRPRSPLTTKGSMV